jgi:enoyl-[acyl-carrier-protein] reductase (NADH)
MGFLDRFTNQNDEEEQEKLEEGLEKTRTSFFGKIDRMVEYYEKNAALPESNTAHEVGNAAAFLCSPLGSGITGTTLYVDKGYHSMGMAADPVLKEED